MKLSNIIPSLLIIALVSVGCSKPDDEPAADADADSKPSASADAPKDQAAAGPKTNSFQPVKLGGSKTGSKKTGTGNKPVVDTKPPKIDDVINGLKPIQIVLGKWQGVVNRAAASEVHEWMWDLRTDKNFPSLVLNAAEGNFFTKARITFDPRVSKYKMTTLDEEDVTRHYEGVFEAEPEDVPAGDGKTVNRTFKLKLAELPNAEHNTRFQFVFNQQENNRYLLEVYRARGKADFRRLDTIGSQRDGTSLARSDEDYGDRTCVISQGLGTSQVSYKGKSYWVCCSGCAAAFKDDPETWIARFEAKQKEMEKK
jgi:hypothetical protein